jgi:hypothetical protein
MLEAQGAVCELVLALKPDHHEALHLLGHAAQAEGDFARAESFYARALAAKPDYAFARLALAQMRLLCSGFAEGGGDYEARFEAITEASGPDWRGLPTRRWRGEPLKGKKIYIWAEQGLGDIAMFAGFLPPLLTQKPARAVLGMFPKLVTLFERSFPALHVESSEEAIHHALGPSVMQAWPQIEQFSKQAAVPFSLAPLKAAYDYGKLHGLFDYAAPLGDLMIHGLPAYVPADHAPGYLKADPARVRAVRARLESQGQGRLIGISWATANRREWMRNVPLEAWLPLLGTPGCHFVSLQHHVSSDEVARFCAEHGCRITVDAKTDIAGNAEDLAALIAAMDEVVTIDNSNIHLAGALGVKATLLLPKGHNFRWPVRREEGTLWYASVKVLRQETAYDWTPVLKEAQARLSKA